MNEVKKTGLFWAAAGVMLAIAAVVAWPSRSRDEGGVAPLIDTELFAEFKDPLTAASMKIVTFDEEQGKLATFEVRKDRESGQWTIPSRDGYPADAVEQMKDAANSLVGLKVLDVLTANAEDHDDLGVAEPKLEDLEVGDIGVGRLVTFKDESQKNLASLIIGDPVKDREGQLYVRKPSQDPVYVVSLDDSPLTTQFNTWIEDDLLQLTSIDIEEVEIKDYNAALNLGGLALTRNYTAKLSMNGSQWELDELLDFDTENPNAAPKKVVLKDGEKLNTTKLNDLKNALDDLKIADVVRKPKGMSENLRADKDLVSDNEAIASLAQRGFYPASGASGDVEILSANGEMSVGLKDGVQYVMRFGNVSGLTEEDGGESAAGVNRYLLVTTRVDESKFPPPDLQAVPQSLKELEALLAPKQPPAEIERPAELNNPADDEEPAAGGEEQAKMESDEPDDSKPEKATEDADESKAESKKTDQKSKKSKTETEEESGETESSGSGEATISGGAQQASDESDADDESAKVAKQDDTDDAAAKSDDAEEKSETEKSETKDSKSDKKNEAKKKDAQPSEDAEETVDYESDEDGVDMSEPVGELDELTEEEKQERLEAEQEKITKENQRKLDERKDKIDVAKKRVRELNSRFADWYYVIPEDTYGKLRIERKDLIQSEAEAAAAGGQPSGMPAGMPPGGFPGGFPGN